MNKRLLKCADFINTDGIVADIGTDHGYLSIYLVQNNKCSHAYACDVNEAPLASAKKNIFSYGLRDSITTILSDGLNDVPSENITDIVIAGMGGELICRILGECKWLTENINIILQPMTKAEVLRSWLYKNGFEIKQEQAVHDDGFDYTVINCFYSGKVYKIDTLTSYIGKISPDTEDNKSYLALIGKRLRTIAAGLESSSDSQDRSALYREMSDKIASLLEENV